MDPSSLGELLEGELKQNEEGDWVIVVDETAQANINLNSLLEQYEGKDVRITLASLEQLDDLKAQLEDMVGKYK